MQRRTSRGTPAMLTTDEQEQLVRLLDRNPELARNVETLIGRKLDGMKFGEKLTSVVEYMELGRSLTPLNAAARAVKDLGNLASDQRGEVALADRVATLETQNDLLREQLGAANERAANLTKELTAYKAEPARAVNSGERVA